jgi:WD40 repeat protein
MQRVVCSIAINDTDSFAYVGTQSGDLLVVDIASAMLSSRFVHDEFGRKGVLACTYINDPNDKECSEYLLAGCGDGVVAKLIMADRKRQPRKDRVVLTRLIKLAGSVTSVSTGRTLHKGHNTFVGTDRGNSYIVNSGDLEFELRGTSHWSKVNDVAFPNGCPDLFVTCSFSDVRVWDSAKRQELLRITVPNMECTCLCLTPPGTLIITGWDDGKVRAFYPESGKLAYVITDAHQGSVSALACTNSPVDHKTYMLVSGGSDGRVRLWKERKMLASLKEHKGVVTKVVIRKNDSEIVSASADGSCIIWDAKRHVRLNAFFDTTMFKAAVYHPDDSQLLTAGSDRKITYWDATDANAIRVIEGSDSEINALDIEPDGTLFVSGGEDRLIKVWHYDEGAIKAIGEGHSGGITRLCISPDQRFIVSVGSEGAIYMWKMFSE